MHEYIVNLHMHTPYSDGRGTHQEIAQAAIKTGLDVVIVTDHNIWTKGHEGYYENGGKRVLLLVGEEVHDQARVPQKNHLLIFGTDHEMAHLSDDPQQLIDCVNQFGGLSFIAHPLDPPSETFGEADLSWVDWEVSGFTGIELWNAMSEFKSLLTSKAAAIYYAFIPKAIAHGPFKSVLKKWDELLTGGKRVVAVGGSDAHALIGQMGPLKKILFPYEFHFQSINTHILTNDPFTGNFELDKKIVLDTLKNGRAFIGYDLPSFTKGFIFQARNRHSDALMGEEIQLTDEVNLQINLPRQAECQLIKDGSIVKIWNNQENITFVIKDPGIYRVEAYRKYLGKRRAWIFSNPIYVK